MPGNDFLFGYFFARRFAKPSKREARKYPKMPSGPWRIAAVICVATGAALSWLLFRNGNSGILAIRVVFGGLVGLVIGMYVVETVWERRRRPHESGAPVSPIGPRG